MYNKVILIGRLTSTPELHKTNNDKSVARATIAINRRFKDQNGEREADFIFFGHHPEFFLKRVYHLIQVEQRHMQTHFSVLYFTEIQYLIDQLQHLFGILFHQIHVLHSFLR